jgi:superfamily II DNA or RNA helicase
MLLSRQGATIKISDLTESEKKLVNRELFVAPVTLNDDFPKKFKVFKRTDNHVFVPRYWALENLKRLPVTHDYGVVEPMKSLVKFTGSLRKELKQVEATDALLKQLRDTGGGILSLDTGFGKTVCSIYTACQLKVKTMILVHKKFLEEQFEETIKRFVPDAKISKVRGDSCDISGDFIIASIQTLMVRKYTEFEGIGCLIVDESHHIAAESFSQTMFGISFKYVIGLSATPTRKDGLTRLLHWFMGTTAYEVRRTLQKNVSVKIIPFTHAEFKKPPPVNKRGDICYTSLITKICEIRDRTLFIAEETKKIAETGRRVLVLSHRRQHAIEIKDILVSLGISAATYLGGDKVEPDAQVICATYHLASEGYDNPRLSGLVLATPSSDVVQACGRILRGGSGNDPIIVDIVDQYSLFLGQVAKRKTFYRKIGFNMGKDAPPEPKIEEQLSSMFIDDD